MNSACDIQAIARALYLGLENFRQMLLELNEADWATYDFSWRVMTRMEIESEWLSHIL